MHIVQALAALTIGGSELVVAELTEYLRRHGDRVTVLGAGGPLDDRVARSGADRLDWPIGRKRLGTLRYIRRLRRWLADERPDVVHAHSRLPAWICRRALAGLDPANRPAFVTTVHGCYSVSPYSAVMARGDRVICVSGHVRRYVLAHYPFVESDRTAVIHGGVDHERFAWGHRPPPGWRDGVEAEFPALRGRRWLLLPARLSRYKGQADLVRLGAALASRFDDLQVILAGGHREGTRVFDELAELTAKLGIAERVTLVGARDDIREWLAAATLVFSLTRDPPEAFGRTVLEALSLGTPVVAWNHGGVAEILATMFPDGGVPAGDLDALAERTAAFLERPPEVPPSDAFGLDESMARHRELYRAVGR